MKCISVFGVKGLANLGAEWLNLPLASAVGCPEHFAANQRRIQIQYWLGAGRKIAWTASWRGKPRRLSLSVSDGSEPNGPRANRRRAIGKLDPVPASRAPRRQVASAQRPVTPLVFSDGLDQRHSIVQDRRDQLASVVGLKVGATSLLAYSYTIRCLPCFTCPQTYQVSAAVGG